MENEIPRIEETRELKNLTIEYVFDGISKAVELKSRSIWQLEFPIAYDSKEGQKFFKNMFAVINGELSEQFVDDFLKSPNHTVDLKKIKFNFSDGDIVEFAPSDDECLVDIAFGFTYVNNYEVVAITYGDINPHYILKRYKREIEDFHMKDEPVSETESTGTLEDLFND